MRRVCILAVTGVNVFDLATAIEVFSRARLPDGRPPYEVVVCGPKRNVDAGAVGLRITADLSALIGADTVIIPGNSDWSGTISPSVRHSITSAAAAGTRIASICTGAFLFAATGLLDGQRVTTHWNAASQLADKFPALTVDPSVLYIDNARFLTSAGAAAGLDLCLHIVRTDYGAAVAAETARACVMPLERSGGQAQYITNKPPVPDNGNLDPLLRWMIANLNKPLTLNDLAHQSQTTTRTLLRHFHDQTTMSPLQWLHNARIRRAQQLLETTNHSIERITTMVGYESVTAFRHQFKRHTGTTPRSYRLAFTSSPNG